MTEGNVSVGMAEVQSELGFEPLLGFVNQGDIGDGHVKNFGDQPGDGIEAFVRA